MTAVMVRGVHETHHRDATPLTPVMSQIDAAAVTSPRIVQKSRAAQFPLIEAALLSLNEEEEIMFSKFIIASAAAAAVMVAAASSANAQYRSGSR
jgi:hypothetical protein